MLVHMSKTTSRSNSSPHPRKDVRIILFAFGTFLLQFTLMILQPKNMEDSGLAITLAATISSRQKKPFWVDHYVNRIARPFVPFHGIEWCQVDHRQSLTIQEPAHKTVRSSRSQPLDGLMLTKVHKAGSTTAAGVTLSIAYRVAQRRQQILDEGTTTTNVTTPTTTRPMCRSHFYHDFAIYSHHSNRNLAKSFLWTTVRLPHTRAESAYYYYQSPERYDDDKEHLQFLSLSRGHQLRLIRKRSERLVGYYGNLYEHGTSFAENVNVSLRYQGTMNATMGIPDNSIIETNPEHLALEHVRREVLDYYNFVAVTERWAESMAVLKMLLLVSSIRIWSCSEPKNGAPLYPMVLRANSFQSCLPSPIEYKPTWTVPFAKPIQTIFCTQL